MIKVLTSIIVLFALAVSQNVYPTKVVGTYFPNWAQYTAAPYTFTPASLKPIISKVNVINYAFAYFCPSPDMIQPYWVQPPYSVCDGKQPFQITNIEYNDAAMYKEIIQYKSTDNPNLKVMISVGGNTYIISTINLYFILLNNSAFLSFIIHDQCYNLNLCFLSLIVFYYLRPIFFLHIVYA